MGDPDALGIPGETGSFEINVTSRERRFEITFADTYENPVLFVQPITGGDPITAQPVFVESTGALVSLGEAVESDGEHNVNAVTLNWAVFEAGNYELADGRGVKIGAVDSGTSSYDMADGTAINPDLETVSGQFDAFAPDAAILAQAQRGQANVWQTVRMERTTTTELTVVSVDPTTGMPTFDETESLSTVTLRHSRETAVEDAEDPEATVGPIGYLIIGALSGAEHDDLTQDTPVFNVDDDAANFDVSLPRSVFKALGGDPDTESTNISYNTDRDSLSIVRITAVGLLSVDNGYYVDETDGQLNADASFDDAMTFVRILFSDGTSAFFGGGSGMRLTAINGALDWNSGTIGRSARFGVTEFDDGTVSLHSWFGHYVSVAANGSLSVDGTDVGNSEKFYMVDLGDLAMSPTPTIRLQEQDMDGDDDPEVVMLAEQDDGTGYFVLDPLGIADTIYKAGYALNDDFIAMLSVTQKAALVEQLDDVEGIDSIDDIDGETLKAVIDTMDDNDLDRSYEAFDFEVVLEGSLYETGTTSDDGLFGATVTICEYSVMVDDDEFGTGYRMTATLFSISGNIGGVISLTLSVGTVYAACDVDSNGFAFGGGVELVSVTVMVGDEDGSYASASAGVGNGWYVAGSWGQNDQYGATVDLPIIPIAVSVYVKGDDVVNVANDIGDFAIETYDDVANFAEHAWDATSDWSEGAANDVAAGVEDTYNDARAAVSKVGNTAIILAEDATGDFLNLIDDVGAGLSDALDDVSDAFATVGSSFGSVINAIDDFISFSWI